MPEPTSIAVVGAGAIGGVLGAALGDAGHTVLLCDRVPFESLSRTFDGETRHYRHPVATSPEGLGPVEWLLLCTKAHQVAGAAPWLEQLVGPDTRVGVMQNGVDHAERVKSFVPPERTVPAIMALPVEAIEPGHVVQQHAGVIEVPDTAPGRALASLFPGDGPLQVEPVPDFRSAAWAKLAFNAVAGGVGCLALGPLRLATRPSVRALVTDLFEEVMAVARAEGATFPPDFVETTLAKMATVPEHWESIAVDRRERRRMEWRARNAVVGETARRHGIATPLNDAVTALLEVIDDELAPG